MKAVRLFRHVKGIFILPLLGLILLSQCTIDEPTAYQDTAEQIEVSLQKPGEVITICHKPGTPAEKTLVIPIQALAGHLGHGDVLGSCQPPSIELSGRVLHGLAYDSGVLWATHRDNFGKFRISKINPTTGQILLESNDLGQSSAARGITVALGSLWISDARNDDITRIDPANFNVISSFNTPGSEPNGIAFDGTNLWLTDPFFQKIYELNTSGGVVSNFVVGPDRRPALEWENNGMWTNNGATGLSHYLPDGTIDDSVTITGLPDGTVIYDLAIGSGKVYLSTHHSVLPSRIYILDWPR